MKLNIIKTIIEEIRTEVVSEIEMKNRYYWNSRSVYAIEFRKNIYNKLLEEDMIHEITLIRVYFEEDIIRSVKAHFSKKFPLKHNFLNNMSQDNKWADELVYALLNEGYFDERTKEQFDKDFNNVIQNLQKLR